MWTHKRGHTNEWLCSSTNKIKQNPKLMPQNRQLNWWVPCSLCSLTMWLTQWEVSRAGCWVCWNQMPTDDCSCCGLIPSETIKFKNITHASSKPWTFLPVIFFMVWSYRLVVSPSRNFLISLNDRLVIQVGRPKMKPSGLRPVSSASLATKGQSKQHPLLKFSFVPPTSSEWSEKVWVSSLILKEWISGPRLPVLLLSPNEKTADKHESNINKVTNPKP
jgi:hypothetical protein